tara:strand:+ start:54 stop:377 length:324 start_codon:yes stop_codon:yes gene_type:complete
MAGLEKGSYIDTQGMGGPMSPEEAAKFKNTKQEYKPAVKTPRRIITPELCKELKILVNEVLDEREYKKKMTGPYDVGGYELPPSYFDVEHFKHPVTEDEPPYKDWSQ